MRENPFGKTNKLMNSATRVNVAGGLGFLVLAIVCGALHITALLIAFLILAVLCAAVAFFLTVAAVRQNSAAVDEVVREARAEQQRRMNG